MDIIIILVLAALVIGGAIAFVVLNNINKGKGNSILDEAKKEAEQIKKDKIFQAKEKFLELKSEHEKVINQRNQKISKY